MKHQLHQLLKLFFVMLCMSMSTVLRAQSDSANAQSEVVQTDTAQVDTLKPGSKSVFTHIINPSAGATFQNISKSGTEVSTLQWLVNVQARMQYESSNFALVSSLYLQFGQLHSEGNEPVKTQDNLIVSITPSLMLFPSTGIRLFLETTAETTMKEGMIDTAHTEFLDPLFLYQSLFVGQKLVSNASDGSAELSFTYGIGYAVQQTITHKFILQPDREFKTSNDNPLSSIAVETGVSALIDLVARKQLSENVQLNLGFKTVYLGKETSWKDYTKARISSLSNLSLSYKIFNLEYNFRLVYDSNFSLRRQIDQSLVAGLRFEL